MTFTKLPQGVQFTPAPNHINEDSELSSDAKVLAYYIAGRSSCWIFWRDKILQDTGLSRGQYQRAVKALEAKQYVKRSVYFDPQTEQRRLFFTVLPAYYTPPRPQTTGRPVAVSWMAPPKPGWHVPWAYEVIDHYDPLLRAVGGSAHQ